MNLRPPSGLLRPPRGLLFFKCKQADFAKATGRFGKAQADLQLLEADFPNLLWVHVKGFGLVKKDFRKSASLGTKFVLRRRAKYKFLDIFECLLE